MSADQSRRRQFLFAGTLALLLVAALLLPPLINLNRYQRQIAASLSASLGRTVEVSGVRLRLLPRPALEIGDFTVNAAPGFGAEPILQCSSVTAALRLSSLWRGRLEIARISLDEPSLNLTRSASGQWSFESLLVQASRTPQAPTAGHTSGGQHRFPYIEATNARINFKQGDEKLPFSFLNADVSIWLERPEQWQLRFAAQPARTDISLSLADTGLVRVSGSIRRAVAADNLPLDLDVEWRKAPLGQVSRMLTAQDLGWRGGSSLTAHVTGTPAALKLDLKAAASDFHRESYPSARPMNLEVHCGGTYQHMEGLLDGIYCFAPVGKGSLELTGSWQQLHESSSEPELRLAVSHVPAEAAMALLRHLGGRLGHEIALRGSLDGTITYGLPPAAATTRSTVPLVRNAVAAGSLKATELALQQGDVTQQLPDLSFTLQPSPRPATAHAQGAAAVPALVLEPTRINLGAPQPMVLDARLTTEGFLLHASGAARMQQLLPLAAAFQVLPASLPALAGEGTADANLTFQGNWTPPAADDFAPSAVPTPTYVTMAATLAEAPISLAHVAGTLALHGAVFQPAYLPEPLHVQTATAVITPAELRWTGISASMGSQRFSGSLRMPLPCTAACVRHFDLSASDSDLTALAAALRGDDLGVMSELLSRVRLRSEPGVARWPPLDGTLHVARLTLGRVIVSEVAASLSLEDGRLLLRSFDGRTLGGVVHLSGAATLGGTPVYHAQLQMTDISAPELSQMLEEQWGPGTLELAGDLRMSGRTPAELSSSAAGRLHWQWTGGALPELTTSALSHFDRWSGDGRVTNGSLLLLDSRVLSDGEELPVTGTIGRDRSLDLMIGSPGEIPVATASGPAGRSAISGTLAAPVVETR